MLVKQGEVDRALETLDRVLAAEPEHLSALFLRASCFNLKGTLLF